MTKHDAFFQQECNMLPYKKTPDYMFEIKTFPSLSTQKKDIKKGNDDMPFVSATHSSVVGLHI